MVAAHQETRQAASCSFAHSSRSIRRGSLVVEVIKEDATHAAALAPVLDQEVVVAPLPELLVVLGVVLVADLRRGNSTGCISMQPSSTCRDIGSVLRAGWLTYQGCAVEGDHGSSMRMRRMVQPQAQVSASCPAPASSTAHVLVCAVEVLHVLLVHVGGGDVGSATKPPLAWDAVPLLSLKVPAGCSRASPGQHVASATLAVHHAS